MEEFGLSVKESKVYSALLGMEPSSVSEIASRANINRTTTYDILESLVNYGLVSHFGEAKKKLFIAEEPEALINFLNSKSREYKEKAKTAQDNLPELKGLYNLVHKKPKVKYYEGDDAIKTIYEDSLEAEKEILAWLNLKNIRKASADYEYFLKKYPKKRVQEGIFIRAIIANSKFARKSQKVDEKFYREMRIVPKEKMDIVPECYIYGDKVAYMSHGEKFGVVIESKDIADAQRALFELAWEDAEKYN